MLVGNISEGKGVSEWEEKRRDVRDESGAFIEELEAFLVLVCPWYMA